eukprot:CAMPEP_0176424834 /NCGR_PEP_ID=MMETSP0127-20121128/11056_1 /TAXON_ID=938130 /ORGANISM="Platyophrya macrostoma, Strain WH" /LENGTH=242 /DNA_ID=CAMNT_0017805933 /DNA_START=63 /DNA_END=791 /DNA_ORIENTATION=+
MLGESSDTQNSIVKLNLSHSNTSLRLAEIRFDLFDTILAVKGKIEKHYGTVLEFQELILQDGNGNTVCSMNEDDRCLGYYAPKEFYNIHVIDLDPNSETKDIDDLSQIAKYEISEENYNSMSDNFRKFKEKLVKSNPGLGETKEKIVKDENFMKEEAVKFDVDARCRLIETGKRGVIKYIGPVDELGEGWFIGVKLDEAYGKNDGSVEGAKYFECAKNHGVFVRPDKVEQGDYPVLELEDEI